MAKTVRKIILSHHRAPGDTLVLTGLVRDIALTYPGRFVVGVDTSAMDFWRHNPHVDPELKAFAKKRPAAVEHVKIQYGRGIRDQNYESLHFLPYFHKDFERQCNVKVPLQLPYPDVHLSEEERTIPLVEGRYWCVISGGKSDFTTKVWDAKRLQQVVFQLTDMGLGVVQLGSNDTGHWHPPMEAAINLVGRTNLRDMARLIYHADGIICGVTCGMHLAAALQRPCVCLAGGREAWWWEAYVRENKGLAPVQDKLVMPHQFLHTIGLLDCCKQHGCWKNKVVALRRDKSICYHPVVKPGQPVPLCMDMITANHVIEAVMRYYEDKSLPPINASSTVHKPPQMPPNVVQVAPPAEQAVVAIAPPVPAQTRRQSLLGLFDAEPDGNGRQTDTAATHAGGNGKAVTPCAGGSNKAVKAQATATVPVPAGMTPREFMQKAKFRVNPHATLEGRPNQSQQTVQVATVPGAPHPAVVPQDPAIFDHPDVGGCFTVCALFFGPDKFFDLHQRCLNAIISTVPQGRIDLRVGSNALNKKSLAMINGYVEQGIITKHYQHHENAWKYPVMREMFNDPACPLNTKWVLWFDDDSICDRTPAWINILAQAIIQYHRSENAHMFGAPFVWSLKSGQQAWYESRPWYRGKEWRLHNGKPAPNGSKIIFCTGGFWAITAEAIKNCDIPDAGIGHNGGDVTIGEQLYQGGYRMKAFNAKKQYVFTSSVPRRGVTTPMPGTSGHQQLQVV
jgi:ADP-heptose:LPS heptosyltransferase